MKARVELKKVQSRYKINFDRMMRKGNAYLQAGYYVLLDVQDGKSKDKLYGHAEGPFGVISRSTRTFVIKRGRVVERVNSDRVVKEPPLPTDDQHEEHAATDADIRDKNKSGRSWSVDRIVGHRTDVNGDLWMIIKWTVDFESTWEPRKNILEKLVSRYFSRQ